MRVALIKLVENFVRLIKQERNREREHAREIERACRERQAISIACELARICHIDGAEDNLALSRNCILFLLATKESNGVRELTLCLLLSYSICYAEVAVSIP